MNLGIYTDDGSGLTDEQKIYVLCEANDALRSHHASLVAELRALLSDWTDTLRLRKGVEYEDLNQGVQDCADDLTAILDAHDQGGE